MQFTQWDANCPLQEATELPKNHIVEWQQLQIIVNWTILLVA